MSAGAARTGAPRALSRLAAAALDWRGTGFLARAALCSAYLLGGIVKLLDFPAAVAEQAHFGVPLPTLSAGLTIAVELVGPALVLTRRLAWLGAGMLAVFTVLAALVANAFWTLQGTERFAATNAFFEHLGLVGGFVLVVLLDRRER